MKIIKLLAIITILLTQYMPEMLSAKDIHKNDTKATHYSYNNDAPPQKIVYENCENYKGGWLNRDSKICVISDCDKDGANCKYCYSYDSKGLYIGTACSRGPGGCCDIDNCKETDESCW